MNIAHEADDPLFDPDVVQEPHGYYRELRYHDPVHEVVPGTFLVTTMELVTEAVNRTEDFSSGSDEFLHKGDWKVAGLRKATSVDTDELSYVLVAADGEDHQRHRRVVSKHLSTAKMQAMEPEFRALVAQALGDVQLGHFDWMSTVAEPLPMVMVARILGLPDAWAPELKKAGYAQVERLSGFVPEDRIQPLEDDGVNGLGSVIEAYGQARQGSTDYDNGLIGVVAHAVAEGELNDIEAMSIISLLISAGGESTTSLTGTAVRILAERPDLQAELRAQPSLVARFVEEALRWDPPFRGMYRAVTRDTELGGKSLAGGSHLVLMWPAANRDEAVYEQADEVRLDRPNPRHHVAFGWGVHLCVGAPLARVEAKSAIETLLDMSHSFQIDEQQLPLRYHQSLMVRRLVALPLAVDWNT